MSFWQYLLARLVEPSTLSAIAALATGFAASVSHPTVQAVAGTVAAAAGVAAVLTPEGTKTDTVVKLVTGGIQGAAASVAAASGQSGTTIAQEVAAGVTGAVAGVASASTAEAAPQSSPVAAAPQAGVSS